MNEKFISDELNTNDGIEQELNAPVEKHSFSVFAYTIITEDKPMYCHWSKGLNMVIEKDGVEIKLNGEELKHVVASLPRTIGGGY